MTINTEIRLASNSDVDEIVQLSKEWEYKSLDKKQRQSGYLYKSAIIMSDSLRKIISEEELIVCTQNNQIIGFYLIDNVTQGKIYKNNKKKFKQFINPSDKIDISRVALRAQVVVKHEFHNMGIPIKMLNYLKLKVKSKYDYLFGSVSKFHSKLIAHEKIGWKLIGEDSKWNYVIYQLNSNFIEKDSR